MRLSRLSLLLGLVSIAATGCRGGEQPTQLSQFATCSDLEAAVKDLAVQELRWDGRPVVMDPLCRGCELGMVDNVRANISNANVEEIGQAEPDFVKNDALHLYAVSGSDLVIVQAVPADAMTEVARLPLEGHRGKLLLNGDSVIVLTEIWDEASQAADGSDPELSGNVVKATFVDVSDRSAPSVFRELYIEGRMNNARVVDGTLYMVTARWLRGPVGAGDDGVFTGRISESDLSSWLPRKVDLVLGAAGWTSERGFATSCDQVYEPANPAGTVMTSVTSIDLGDLTGAAAGFALLSPAGVVKISDTSIHLGVLEPETGAFRDRNKDLNTRIHSFDVTDGPLQPSWLRSGQVRGHVLDSFSIDDSVGLLRVATAIPDVMGEQHGLYVMDGIDTGYDTVGVVEGFGIGETLTTARFDGVRGYVATFEPVEMIDPLFTFDLSNPTAPRITDDLEFDGSTNYLYPVDDHTLVGVGATTTDFNEVDGVQVMLFDVSDMNNTSQAALEIVSTGFDWTAATWDLRSIAYYPTRNTLSVPIIGGDWAVTTSTLRLYQPDPAAQSVGFIGSIDASEFVFEVGDPVLDTVCNQVRRTIFIDDTVYAVTSGGLKAAPVSDLSNGLSSLPFDDLGNCFESGLDGGSW